MARLGEAGLVWAGKARRGKSGLCMSWQARRRKARPGSASRGWSRQARQGLAWPARAWTGEAGHVSSFALTAKTQTGQRLPLAARS